MNILPQQNYSYLIINILAVLIPLALSFDRKVAFYKKWKFVWPAILVPALIFIIWDIIFTYNAIWGFNERYLSGITVINLPVEEVLFFFTIPYACLFTYEVIKVYFPDKIPGIKFTRLFYSLLAFVLTGVLIVTTWRTYTHITFSGLIILLILLLVKKQSLILQHFFPAYMVIVVPFLLVNGALTGTGFEEPIVWYNDQENLGVRILTIPVEDLFYGMLLILGNVFLFEKLQWWRFRKKSAAAPATTL